MNIAKIILFVILLIAAAALAAANINMISLWQLLYIDIILVVIMAVMTIILTYRIHKAKTTGAAPDFPEVKVVIPKVRIDDKFLRANSELLKKNIISTNPFRTCIFRISMEINNSIEQLGMSAVRLRESRIVENTIKKSIVAKETYVIDTVVGPNEKLNFKFDNDIDIIKLFIDELYVP